MRRSGSSCRSLLASLSRPLSCNSPLQALSLLISPATVFLGVLSKMHDEEKTNAPVAATTAAAAPHDEIEAHPSQTADVHHIDGHLFSDKVPTKHDDALDFLRSTGNDNFTYTDDEARKVRWKIDLYMMPLVRPVVATSSLGVFKLTALRSFWAHSRSISWTRASCPMPRSLGSERMLYVPVEVPT